MGKNDAVLSTFLGFKLQEHLALFLLLKMRKNRKNSYITIEELDDVALISNNGIELYQVKNYSSSRTKLTDASVDLWKTIYNWIKKFKEDKLDEKSKLRLYVNSKSSYKDSDFVLKMNKVHNDNDFEELYQKLLVWYEEKYKNKNNKTIKEYLDFIFVEENKDILRFVLKKFSLIQKQYTPIDELDEVIEKYCTFGDKNSQRFEDAKTFILGEFNKIILESEKTKNKIEIDIDEFHKKLDQFSIKYSNVQRLRSTLTNDDVDISQAEKLSFINQLNQLDIENERIEEAKFDYYKTKKDVYNYLHDILILDRDYESLKKRLLRKWNSFCLEHNDGKTKSDSRMIFAKCQNVDENLAGYLLEQDYFIIGSYHILVEDDKKMHWYCEKEVKEDG